MLNIFLNQNPIHKSNRFYTLFRAMLIYGLVALTISPAFSSQALYTLKINQDIVRSGPGFDQADGDIGNVHFNDPTTDGLKEGTLIDIPIPGETAAKGKVIKSIIDSVTSRTASALSGTRRTIISLENDAGSVEIVSVNNTITEMLLHDVVGEKIYTADINSNGDGLLSLQDNNNYYCVKYPETDILTPITQRSPQTAAAIPDVSTLRNLQSRPGSANVLFIDYWGGSLTNSVWNANYTSNNPINYTAYDTDGNPGSFSSSERYSMWLAWHEAVEDFAPFDINITTSRAVYNVAAVTDRSQMIVTTTSSWYGNAGGVAYVGIFDNNSNYYKVGWTWNLSDRSMGMTISHEAGHQMGLAHDGIGTQSYYQGHGAWGPIMGAPFGKPYVQWSKGEYPGANQSEDDIAKVSGKLGLIADDAGNGYAGATNLNLPVNNRKRLISYQDTDAYKFTLGSTGPLEIKVIPLLGDEDESRAANLAMDVSLVKINASGGVISNVSMIRSSDNSPLSPSTNKFIYNSNVSSGIYALRITPKSPDTNWTTGFGNYSNAGEYRLSVNGPTDGNIKTIGKPAIDRSTDIGIFIWENSANKWVMNVVSGGTQSIVEIDVLSQQSLSDVVPLSMESSDVFTQLPNGLDMRLIVTSPWMDGVKFTVQNQSSTCVSTTNSNMPIFLGPDRVQMPGAFDLSTLGTCNAAPGIKTIGKPAIDRSTDAGIFIWENTANKWVMNVVSGDRPRIVEVDVLSQQSLSDVVPLSIESSDVFTQLPKSLDMSLNVKAPWLDGVKFTVQDRSTTCVSTTSSNVPIFVGPARISVGNNINLDTLTSCQ